MNYYMITVGIFVIDNSSTYPNTIYYSCEDFVFDDFIAWYKPQMGKLVNNYSTHFSIIFMRSVTHKEYKINVS